MEDTADGTLSVTGESGKKKKKDESFDPFFLLALLGVDGNKPVRGIGESSSSWQTRVKARKTELKAAKIAKKAKVKAFKAAQRAEKFSKIKNAANVQFSKLSKLTENSFGAVSKKAIGAMDKLKGVTRSALDAVSKSAIDAIPKSFSGMAQKTTEKIPDSVLKAAPQFKVGIKKAFEAVPKGAFGNMVKGVGKNLGLLNVAMTTYEAKIAWDNSDMRSFAGAIGSGLGCAVGVAGAGSFGLATGGVGLVAVPAAGMAGSMAGAKLGESLYDGMQKLMGNSPKHGNLNGLKTDEAARIADSFGNENETLQGNTMPAHGKEKGLNFTSSSKPSDNQTSLGKAMPSPAHKIITPSLFAVPKGPSFAF